MKRFSHVAALCLLCALSCAKTKSVAPPSRESLGQVITHRVETGETWESLARDFYGDAGRARELAQDNGTALAEAPIAGSAVRVLLTAREVASVRRRLDAAREYNAGLDLAASGAYAEAVTRFEESLKLDPELSDASFNLAIAYEKLGFHERAIDILRDLVSRSPGNVDYLYALGASRFAAGDLGGARRAFGEVLDRDSTNRKALFSLGVVCEKTGKLDEAKRRFERYLELDPEGEWAHAARSHLESILRQRR
jgi:tetratricopeptide (TPR) repeat protein